tara:strand:+ start:8584 stop:13953 length:5370 start_codon:yes stop_codon:yes gene_type:complete
MPHHLSKYYQDRDPNEIDLSVPGEYADMEVARKTQIPARTNFEIDSFLGGLMPSSFITDTLTGKSIDPKVRMENEEAFKQRDAELARNLYVGRAEAEPGVRERMVQEGLPNWVKGLQYGANASQGTPSAAMALQSPTYAKDFGTAVGTAMTPINYVSSMAAGHVLDTLSPLANQTEEGFWHPQEGQQLITQDSMSNPTAVYAFIDYIGRTKLQEFEEKKEQYRKQGLNRAESIRKAYDETELPTGAKLALEVIFDPLATILPGGVAFKGGKALGSVGAKVGKSFVQDMDFYAKNLYRTDPRVLVNSQEWQSTFAPKLKQSFDDLLNESDTYIDARAFEEAGTGVYDPSSPTQALGASDVGREISKRNASERYANAQAESEYIRDVEFQQQLAKSTGIPTVRVVNATPDVPSYLYPEQPMLAFDNFLQGKGMYSRLDTSTVRKSKDGQIIYAQPNVIRELIGKSAIRKAIHPSMDNLIDPKQIASLATGETRIYGGDRFLSGNEIEDLSKFLTTYGVDPRTTTDELLTGGGHFHVDKYTGERQFIMGAYDDPSKVRRYVTYSPTTRQWGITDLPEPKKQLINIETGRNINESLNKIRNSFDGQIAAVEAQMANEVVGSVDYKHLARQFVGLQQQKMYQIKRLKNKPTTVDSHSVDIEPKYQLEEVEDMMKMYERLYFDPKGVGANKYKASQKTGFTHPNDRNPFVVVAGNGGNDVDGSNFFNYYRTDRTLHDQVLFEFYDGTVPSFQQSWQNAVNKTAASKGLPTPPNAPGATLELGATPGDPVGHMDELINSVPDSPNVRQSVQETNAFGRWSGARKIAGTEIKNFYEDGVKLLKELGQTQMYKGRLVIPEEVGVKLLKALHGEGEVPQGYQKFIDHVLELKKQEEAAYIAFDNGSGSGEIVNAFVQNPNYFPRMWQRLDPKTNKYVNVGDLDETTIPPHLRARTDMSFTQLLAAGYRPVSYNPLDLMTIRRVKGVEHRETVLLVERLKKTGIAVPEDELTDAMRSAGYRIPEIGPAFEGMKIAAAAGGHANIGRFAVPKQVADQLEVIYGKSTSFNVGGIDLFQGLSKFNNVAKRSILSFSGFQHQDMFFRAGAFASSPLGLRRGAPVKLFSSLAGRIIASSFYKGDFKGLGRRGVSRRALDDSPIYQDSDLSFKMIAEQGWNYGGDTSIIKRHAIDSVEELEKSIDLKGIKGNLKLVKDRLGGAIKFWESGLFDGVYAETQMFMLENAILPFLRKQYPSESSQQLARRAASEVNMFSSSLGDWESVFTNATAKDFMRLAAFSTNETESWLRSISRSIPRGDKANDSSGLYRQYWLGYATWLAAVGNAVNLMRTGELLPMQSYSPLAFGPPDDPEGIIQFSTRYNSKFLSPKIMHGRNGQPIYLDIVGQADTPFQWLFSPLSAAQGRTSPLLNVFKPFATGKTFYGNALPSALDKAQYSLLQSLPIGAFQAIDLGAEHNQALREFIPEGESGIGTKGRLFQIGGFNVRKETTRELLNELARREGFKKIPAKWNNPMTWFNRNDAYKEFTINLTSDQRRKAEQRNQDIVNELSYRAQTGDERGQEWQSRQIDLNAIELDRRDHQNKLAQAVRNEEVKLKDWYNEYRDIQNAAFLKRRGVDSVYKDLLDNKVPKEDLPRARYEWYKSYEEHTNEYGKLNYDLLDEAREDLYNSWTPEQREHIDMLRQKDHSVHYDDPFIIKALNLKDKYQDYFDVYKNYFKRTGQYNVYKQYRSSNFPNDFLDNNPQFAQQLKSVEEYRKQQRESNLELAYTLVLLGYMEMSTYLNIKNN